jgi:DNA-directed RNA polymerase specialized sigma24 family protein
MDDDLGALIKDTRKRRPRLLGRFPKIHIHTSAEMARTLQKWRWLLEKHAEAELGPGALAEEAVRTTIVKLLAIEEPDIPHLLDAAMQVLRNQCHSIKLRLAREAKDRERRKAGALYDPVLDMAISGPVAEAVERLPADEHQTFLLAAQGVSPAMIAYLLGLPSGTVRGRLFRARARIRAELKKNASVAATTFSLLSAHPQVRTGPAHPHQALIHETGRVAMMRRGITARISEVIAKLTASPQATAGAALVMATAGWTPVATLQAPAAQTATAAIEQMRAEGNPGPDRAVAASAQLPPLASPRPSGGPPVPHMVHVGGIARGGGAATETPEDVRVTTAATPPRAPGAGPPVIVAIGTGQSCQCQVLLQSLDGGVTWSATDGPLVVLNQLVLPPAYPSDPRIFGSNGAPGVPAYEAAGFGARFHAVALPGGLVAVAAGFDAGDARLFVANATGVWSVNLATSAAPATPHLEIEYASSSGAVAALATPPASSTGPALLVWVPNLAVAPGSSTSPHLSATLMACPSSGRCRPLSDLPASPWLLAVGADAANTVVAYTYSAVFLSRDGGRSFAQEVLPTGVGVLSVAVLGQRGEVWASFSLNPISARVERLDETGAWADVTRGDFLLGTHAGTLIAVDGRRIVDAVPGKGYRCTTLDGTAWSGRCPRS